MMADLTDERLQDYLDGRLSNGERAELEAALRDDPELARRLEAWREIGGALRSGDEELSPGFYARARERFEQTRRPRSRFGFRILSWEVAGLAAAVVLAAAVFLPELMRDPELGRAPARPAESRGEAPRADRRQAGEAPERSEGRESLRDAVLLEEGVEPTAEPAPAAAPLPADADVGVDAADRQELGALEETGRLAKKRTAQRPGVVEIPAAAAPPDGLTVLDTGSAWQGWLAGPAGPALTGLGDPDPGQRLVLVGRTNGIDCSSLRVVRRADRYSISFAAGSARGCALLLPRDGLTIILED